ncbi:MAG: FapA family protein [Desulfobulbaceae bacterium]|nr:FapA family protein [Desulfobulbaceae bacterium]
MPEQSEDISLKKDPFPSGLRCFEAEWGTASVEISYDFLEAYLVGVKRSALKKQISFEELNSLLQKQGINCLPWEEKGKKIIASLAEDDWSGRLLIAQGRVPGKPGGVDYVMFGKGTSARLTDDDTIKLEDESISFMELNSFLSNESPPGVFPGILVKAIGKGEIIAKRQEPINVQVGRDIYGRDIAPPEFKSLIAGQNVRLTEDMSSFQATVYGYITIVEKTVSILSPIILSKDAMIAWYIFLPQYEPVRMPSFKDIVELLKNAGVTRGIKQAPLEKFCKSLAHGDVACWNVIAKGRQPVKGEDAHLEFVVDLTKQSGKVREDGSIDFRELNLVQTVSEGDLVATKHPPGEGIQGYTLIGEVIETEAGQGLKVEGKSNIRSDEKEDGTILFYAECDGLIRFRDGKISIDPQYKVSGNVDFSTGNINVDCDLQISGNICSDFSVHANGNVFVGGNIEPGAKVRINGNLEVKGGIIGDTTEITVLGDMKADFIEAGKESSGTGQLVKTDFIQSAKIVVKGDLHVSQYIYYAAVKAVGKIIVGPGKGERGGSVVGGVICSSSAIRLSVCGSPSFVPTTLILEPTPDKLAKLKKLKESRNQCDADTTKIMRTLNVKTVDRGEISELLESARPDQKRLFIDLLEKLSATIKEKQEVMEDLAPLRKELHADLSKMQIIVAKTYHGNTRIRIGRKEFHEKEDRGPSRFTLRKKWVYVESLLQQDSEIDIF